MTWCSEDDLFPVCSLPPTPRKKILSLSTTYDFYFPTTPLALRELLVEPCVFQSMHHYLNFFKRKGC